MNLPSSMHAILALPAVFDHPGPADRRQVPSDILHWKRSRLPGEIAEKRPRRLLRDSDSVVRPLFPGSQAIMSQPFITRINLKNYRCFDEIEITLHCRLTVLVAANGAGKTAVLDALAVAVGPFVGAFDEAAGKGFEPDDIRQARVRETVGNEMEYAVGGCSLFAEGYVPGRAHDPSVEIWGESSTTWARDLPGPKRKTTTRWARQLVNCGKRLQDAVRTPGVDVVLPVIGYYGTGRLWKLKKLSAGALSRTSRTIGYTDCLDPGSSYKAFAEWFRYWSESALQAKLIALQRNQAPEEGELDRYIASVRRAIDACLAPVGWRGIDYSVARQELVARHDHHGELPVSLLSDGIRNMIGLVADIAFRATKLNPQFGAEASQRSPGLVLIDEVDMHLHPAWQQVVLDGLTGAYPEIQFVVTTHSPQVVSSVPSESIRILHEGKAYGAPHGTEGAESSRILKRVFSVDPRPQANKATRELNDYLDLVYADRWDSQRAAGLRATLDARYRGEEPALTAADLYIENREWERANEDDPKA